MQKLKKPLFVLMLALALLLCGCKQNPPQEKLYAKLVGYFTERGLACELMDGATIDEPAIADAGAWRALNAGGETVYVYFDESNRADYLLTQIDQNRYGYATSFGLRFLLNYRGDNEAVLAALRDME